MKLMTTATALLTSPPPFGRTRKATGAPHRLRSRSATREVVRSPPTVYGKNQGDPIGAHTLTRGEKGRVIRVEFVTFEDFFAELGPRPGDWCIADRRNRAGNWSPGNVRWVRDNHPPKRHNWKPPGSRGDEKLYRPQTSAKLQQQLRERRVFARIVELRGPEFIAWVFEKEDINSVEKRDRQIARGLWIDTRSVDNKPSAVDPHFVRLCEAHGWDPRRFGNAQRHFTQAEVARLIEKYRKTVSRVRKRVIKRWDWDV